MWKALHPDVVGAGEMQQASPEMKLLAILVFEDGAPAVGKMVAAETLPEVHPLTCICKYLQGKSLRHLRRDKDLAWRTFVAACMMYIDA
eukprot:1145010-Amphidinium_carterae.1